MTAHPHEPPGAVSPANLRYLEACFYLQAEGVAARRARLAEWLGISAPTVSEAVARLVRDGLLVDEPSHGLRLTGAGERAAAEIVRRHRIVEAWAVTSLGLDWVTADDEAQRLAPVISETALARLHEVIGHPARCPHGNLIPGESATEPPTRRLSEVEPGRAVRVVRISELAEHDVHDVLDAAFQAGLIPGAPVEVRSVRPDGARELRVREHDVRVWPRLATSVWVAAGEPDARGAPAPEG